MLHAVPPWGPPPDGSAPVIAVGLTPTDLALFRNCRTAAHIENSAGIDNQENGRPVVVCAGPRGAWSTQWHDLRRLG